MSLLNLRFGSLNIPLALRKCVGSTVCLEYLGIILNSSKMQARLIKLNEF